LNEDSAKLARPVRVPLNGTVGQPGRIEAVENFAADAKAKDTRHSDGGRIRSRGYFFPLTVLAEVLDDARVIPRPNSGSPLMRFQG
jgi:hypothetical protein